LPHHSNSQTALVSKIPAEKIAEIVNLWVAGADDREIVEKTGISIGSVSKYIRQERKRQPDLEDLRKLRKALFDANLPIIDVLRAARILGRLVDSGVFLGADSLVHVEDLSKTYGEALEKAIAAGLTVRALEESEGKSFKKIATQAKSLKGRVATLEKAVKSLEGTLKSSQAQLGDLGVYQELKKDLDSLELTAERMARFVSFHKELVSMGFTESVARVLAKELNRQDSLPSDAASTLAHLLSKSDTLEAAVGQLERSKKELEAAVGRLKGEERLIKTRIVAEKNLDSKFKEISLAIGTIKNKAEQELETVREEAVAKMNQASDGSKESLASTLLEVDAAARSTRSAIDGLAAEVKKTVEDVVHATNEAARLELTEIMVKFLTEANGSADAVIPFMHKVVRSYRVWLAKRGEQRPMLYNHLDALEEELKSFERNP